LELLWSLDVGVWSFYFPTLSLIFAVKFFASSLPKLPVMVALPFANWLQKCQFRIILNLDLARPDATLFWQ